MDKENVFADVTVEGAKETEALFSDNKETTPAESQPAKEEEGKEPVQGEPNAEPKEDDPFHIRWRERETKLKADYEARLEEKARELEEKFSSRFKSDDEPVSIPKWFSRIHGEDPDAWNEYKEYDAEQRETIKRELVEEQEAQRRQADEEVKYWNKWVDDEVSRLSTEGKQFDRNELIKVMLDYRPTDQEGNFDFNAGYRILEALKIKEADPEKSQARKKIADLSTKSSNTPEAKKTYVSSVDIRKKSWSDL